MSESFANRIPLNQLRDGQRIDMVADQDQRRRIADRLGLGSIERLEAHATLSIEGSRIRATGRVKAALTQDCAVTREPLDTRADEAFEIVFVPQPQPGGPDEEIELGPEDCDVVLHDGSAIDLGDAVADTLALSLDPYPRSASADAALKEAGVLGEAEAGPFAALAKLKRQDPESP